MSKWPYGIEVASVYQSFNCDPNPSCWLRVLIWKISLGDLNKTIWVFCNSISLPNLLWWKRLCFIYIVLSPLCLRAVAILRKFFELENSSQESLKISKNFVPLLGRLWMNSKSTPWIKWMFFMFLDISP